MPATMTARNASSSATELESTARCTPRAASGAAAGRVRAALSAPSELARLAHSSSAAGARGGASGWGVSVIGILRSVAGQALAQLRELPPADRERLRLAAQLERVPVLAAGPLESLDVRDGDEHAAMRADEVARELFLELLQRLVDEILAVA